MVLNMTRLISPIFRLLDSTAFYLHFGIRSLFSAVVVGMFLMMECQTSTLLTKLKTNAAINSSQFESVGRNGSGGSRMCKRRGRKPHFR